MVLIRKPGGRGALRPHIPSLTPREGVGGATAIARAFTAKMRAGVSDLVVAIASDSTGNDVLDHFQQFFDDYLLPAFPAYLGKFRTWSDTTSAYGGALSDFTACLNPVNGTTLFEDTFARADGAVGTTTSGGQTWAANTQVIASGRVAVPAGGGVLATTSNYGSDNVIYEMDFEALASGTYRIEGLYGSGDRGIFVTFGSTGMNLYRKVTANTAEIARKTLALTVGVTYKAQLIVSGLWIGARIVGSDDASCGGYLTSGEKAEFGQTAYFGGPATNGRYDNCRITTLANTRSLTVYNGSHPGATIDYHATRLASIIPETPDLVWIALGHNNDGTDTAAQFLARMDDLIADMRVLYPGAPVLVSTENYRTDASAAAALERFAILRSAWASRGWGFEEVQLPDAQWSGLLAGDNLHPTIPAGQAQWATIDKAHFGV